MIKKTVIVTGGSNGIGKGVALKFAENGWNVGFTYNTNENEELLKQLRALGVKAESVQMNLSDKTSVKTAFEKLFNSFKSIDCVVCNAGCNQENKLLIDVNDDDLDYIIDSNLKGTILCNKLACENFLSNKKGSLINISSILGEQGSACEVVYSSAKAGIIGLTKALAKEMGQFGVRVNAVAPGMTLTNMTKDFSQQENDFIIKKAVIKRIGLPEDIANAVWFLANDESSYITGECLTVSGGLVI